MRTFTKERDSGSAGARHDVCKSALRGRRDVARMVREDRGLHGSGGEFCGKA